MYMESKVYWQIYVFQPVTHASAEIFFLHLFPLEHS